MRNPFEAAFSQESEKEYVFTKKFANDLYQTLADIGQSTDDPCYLTQYTPLLLFVRSNIESLVVNPRLKVQIDKFMHTFADAIGSVCKAEDALKFQACYKRCQDFLKFIPGEVSQNVAVASLPSVKKIIKVHYVNSELPRINWLYISTILEQLTQRVDASLFPEKLADFKAHLSHAIDNENSYFTGLRCIHEIAVQAHQDNVPAEFFTQLDEIRNVIMDYVMCRFPEIEAARVQKLQDIEKAHNDFSRQEAEHNQNIVLCSLNATWQFPLSILWTLTGWLILYRNPCNLETFFCGCEEEFGDDGECSTFYTVLSSCKENSTFNGGGRGTRLPMFCPYERAAWHEEGRYGKYSGTRSFFRPFAAIWNAVEEKKLIIQSREDMTALKKEVPSQPRML